MPETCGGYCCERFRFKYNETPKDLQDAAERGRGGKEEATQIADMVIYLGESEFDVDGYQGMKTHWYTCKHFDTETRLCKIYETRPQMCRDYNSKSWNRCGVRKCKMPPPEYPKLSAEGQIKKKDPTP